MCLAIPGKITEIAEDTATVNYGNISCKASIRVMPQSKVGDTVLVHAGFVIQILDEKAALDIESLFKDYE